LCGLLSAHSRMPHSLSNRGSVSVPPLKEMVLETRLKDAMLLEAQILKTKVLTSLLNKEKEAEAQKKEVLGKASRIKQLEEVNEKQKNQILKMKSLIQPLRDTIVEQATELTQSQMEIGRMQVKLKDFELKVNDSVEKADFLTRKLEEKTRECLQLREVKTSISEVEEELTKVKSDCEDVKKRNVQIEKELEEKKRLKRHLLTFQQNLGDLKTNRNEKHSRSSNEVKVGVKRKNEPTDEVLSNKKLKIVEQLKVMEENGEVALENEDIGKKNAESDLDQKEKCTFGTEKRQVKILPNGESRERMSLVSEKGLWFLRSTLST